MSHLTVLSRRGLTPRLGGEKADMLLPTTRFHDKLFAALCLAGQIDRLAQPDRPARVACDQLDDGPQPRGQSNARKAGKYSPRVVAGPG